MRKKNEENVIEESNIKSGGFSIVGKLKQFVTAGYFILLIYDMIAINFAYFLALWFRFDCKFSEIPREYLLATFKFIPFYVIFSCAFFWRLRLYKSIWQFASFDELIRLGVGTIATTSFHMAGITVFFCRMPISYYIMGAIIQFFLTISVRFMYRFVKLELNRAYRRNKSGMPLQNAMIIGAGAAGHVILKEIISTRGTNIQPCCVIDDDANKHKSYLEGVPIVGGRDDILANVEKYNINLILYAIPSASAAVKRDILNICKETRCELKTLPGIYQMVNGEVSFSKMKNVTVEELLGRETIKVNMKEIFQYIRGKKILVTGGGGSIGSELCRQIAGHKPEHLIIFDIYENNAYDIEQELRSKYPRLNLTVLCGSVRDTKRINSVFEEYKPDIVYHAAAHKHVPLMETSPCEAIKNNVMGTYKTAYAALKNDCKRFVLISTDKAVNPTNIMGASKRLCEMVIQSMDMVSRSGKDEILPNLSEHSDRIYMRNKNKKRKYQTEFVAVRFGNVLGSNGSVIPLFKKQIEKGGPVTVTHPDIIRYFMTIPEAVGLVLQAGTYAKGGEIFVLDMGVPVKIDTLARNLIKLSGYKPDEDIKIAYTGLRPGEKLYEEKLMEEEGMKKTPNKLIHIGKPIAFDIEKFFKQLVVLSEYCYSNNLETVGVVASIVPTFHSPESDLKMNADVYKELFNEAESAGDLVG